MHIFRELGIRDRELNADEAALYGLGRAYLLLHGYLNGGYGGFGLSVAKYNVLMAVSHLGARNGCIRQHELGARLLVTPANIVKLVNALQREGLVRRRVSAGDRRANEIEITPRGQRLLDRMWDRHLAMVREAVQPLTGAEKEQLARLLEKLWRHLKTLQPSGRRA